MLDQDGLMVARAYPGALNNYTAGWIDHAYGVGAVTNPLTGKTYMVGSDIAMGKGDRFRVDNLSTIQRSNASFSWSVPVDISGRWQFDDNLIDSAAHNDGTLSSGTPTYVYGPQGKAIDLNGAGQGVVIPYSSSNVAYTVSAWVRATNPNAVNIVALSGGAFLSGGMAQLRINKNGKFEHYTFG